MSNISKENQKLKQGAIILVLSSALVKIISALFKLPLSSDFCLGDLGFGYFSSAHDVFMPIYFVAISGFPVAISKIISDFVANGCVGEAKKTLKISKKLILGFAVIFFTVYIVSIFPFVKFTDKTGNSIYSFLAVSPSIIFCLWSACYRGYFEGLGNMQPAAVSNIIEALGKLVFGLGLALIVIKATGNAAFGAAAAMLGISLGGLASAVYLQIRYKLNNGLANYNSNTQQGISERDIAKKIILISVPIVAASLSSSVVALIDGLTVRYQLSNLISQNTSTLRNIYSDLIAEVSKQSGELLSNDTLPTVLYGIRSKAFTLFNLIPTLTMAIGVGLIPTVTQSFTRNDTQSLKSNVSAVFKLSALISFPAGAGYLLFGKRILSLLFGNGISSQIGGEMLGLYGIAVIFAGFSLPLASILQAVSKQRQALLNVCCGIIVKVFLNIILCSIPEINVFGSVYSTIACFFVICLLHLICIIKNIGKINNPCHNILKPFISAVFSVGIAYIFSLLSLSSVITMLSIILAILLYFILMAILNGFDESDFLALPSGEKLLEISQKLKIIR